MAIGNCEACGKQHVPVRRYEMSGMESTQCFLCVGDTDADPYGEISDPEAYTARFLELQRRVNRA